MNKNEIAELQKLFAAATDATVLAHFSMFKDDHDKAVRRAKHVLAALGLFVVQHPDAISIALAAAPDPEDGGVHE